ncbi:signal peptidase I [Bacilli bacterium PM5-9]|nr:signal peptidase I [Bacilli bacterium PM5-9]
MSNEETNVVKKKSFIREIIELVVIFVVMLFIFNFILMSVKVNGTSMVPTYQNGDRGIMVRSLPFNKPDYDKVVVIDYKDIINEDEELIVKRIFAMPNDTFEIKGNKVYVNGKEVEDKHRASDAKMQDYPLTRLGSDEIFVLGDNRNVSKDSRTIGPVKLKSIKAVNGVIFWPLNKIGFMK